MFLFLVYSKVVVPVWRDLAKIVILICCSLFFEEKCYHIEKCECETCFSDASLDLLHVVFTGRSASSVSSLDGLLGWMFPGSVVTFVELTGWLLAATVYMLA